MVTKVETEEKSEEVIEDGEVLEKTDEIKLDTFREDDSDAQIKRLSERDALLSNHLPEEAPLWRHTKKQIDVSEQLRKSDWFNSRRQWLYALFASGTVIYFGGFFRLLPF